MLCACAEAPIDFSLPCSVQAVLAGEQIGGTALADADAWLLVELGGAWDALTPESALPERAQAWLAGLRARHPRLRFLMIRRERPSRLLSCFVAFSPQRRPTGPARRGVFRFEARTHDELALLDLDAILAGGASSAAALGGEPVSSLYVVCAHGKRDACCAKKGVALYRALAETDLDGEPWQSTHQGGHRFAATMLYLPLGIHYGRLEPSHAQELVLAHTRGRLFDLEHYRGHTSLSPLVQRAEAWLRQELDERHIDAFTLLEEQELEGACRGVVMGGRGGARHRVVLAPKTGKKLRMASCSGAEPGSVSYHDVVRYEAHTRA